MTRTTLNFFLDVTLLIVLLAEVWAAAVVRFVFPPGTLAEGWTLWGGTFDQWCNVQFWLLCVFAACVLLHVMLHWTWVCGVASRTFRDSRGKRRQLSDGERTLYGVSLLVVLFHLLGVGIAAALLTVQRPG